MAHRTPLALLLSAALLSPPAIAQASASTSAQAPADMSDEDKMERAKTLYGEGDAAFQSGDFTNALAKFEEAYNVYAPNFHVFNFNIGLAAIESGDCVKAKAAFQRFLDLVADHPERGRAQERLMDIERTGCAAPAPEPEPAPITTPAEDGTSESAYPVEDDDDAPVLTSSSQERKQQADRERRARDAKKKTLLIAGGVLTGVGVAVVAGGAVTLAFAIQDRNELAELSNPGPLGFPTGSYADESVFNLDRNTLPAENIAAIVLLSAGGALTATGIALISLHAVRKKKAGGGSDKAARLRHEAPRFAVAPTWIPGGGAAAAHVRF